MKWWHLLLVAVFALIILNNVLADRVPATINGQAVWCENSYFEPEMWICAPADDMEVASND